MSEGDVEIKIGGYSGLSDNFSRAYLAVGMNRMGAGEVSEVVVV